MRLSLLLACLLILLPLPLQAADLHRLWDEECAACHGHAGSFARAELTVDGGVLKGRRPNRDLRRFLADHAEAEPRLAAALYEMLLAQAQQPELFRRMCSICHVSAAEVARTLVVRDGVLYGRYTGRRIDEFLAGHGRIPADELDAMIALMYRVQGEVSFR